MGTVIGLGTITLVLLFLYVTTPSRFNILIIGSDQRGTERARSDVLMILSVPKSPAKPISLVTIPRDTRVEIAGEGLQKITHAYSLGDRDEGTILGNRTLTTETVKDFLDVPIHATAEITFASFQSIVDLFGGVDIDSGHVNGKKALEVVRDRFRDGGDFARTADQRQILLALAEKLKIIDNARKLYTYFSGNSEARLTWSKPGAIRFGLAALIRRGGHFTLAGVTEGVVPGHGENIYTPEFGKGLYYWVPDEEGTEEMVKQLL